MFSFGGHALADDPPAPEPLPPAPEAPAPFPAEVDIDAVLYEFKGDAREAIRALLHDLAILAADYGSSVSHGYVRGDIPRLHMGRTG
jgi:hypothetical protein